MQGFSRAALWVVFGVVVAVALSAGAFAVANGSVGEPAGPVSVAPRASGDKAPETDHATPSLRPSPSAEPTTEGGREGSGSPSGPSTSTSTSSSSGSSTHETGSSPSSPEEHGGDNRDD
jgi:hypothetical protein